MPRESVSKTAMSYTISSIASGAAGDASIPFAKTYSNTPSAYIKEVYGSGAAGLIVNIRAISNSNITLSWFNARTWALSDVLVSFDVIGS